MADSSFRVVCIRNQYEGLLVSGNAILVDIALSIPKIITLQGLIVGRTNITGYGRLLRSGNMILSS